MQLQAILREARLYLGAFTWCRAIRREFLGLGIGGGRGVFLFEIDAEPGVDTALAAFLVCLIGLGCNDPPVAAPSFNMPCTLVGRLNGASLTLVGARSARPLVGLACFDRHCRGFATAPEPDAGPDVGTGTCHLDDGGEWNVYDSCSLDEAGNLAVRLGTDESVHPPDPVSLWVIAVSRNGEIVVHQQIDAPLSAPYYPNGQFCDSFAHYWCRGASAVFTPLAVPDAEVDSASLP